MGCQIPRAHAICRLCAGVPRDSHGTCRRYRLLYRGWPVHLVQRPGYFCANRAQHVRQFLLGIGRDRDHWCHRRCTRLLCDARNTARRGASFDHRFGQQRACPVRRGHARLRLHRYDRHPGADHRSASGSPRHRHLRERGLAVSGTRIAAAVHLLSGTAHDHHLHASARGAQAAVGRGDSNSGRHPLHLLDSDRRPGARPVVLRQSAAPVCQRILVVRNGGRADQPGVTDRSTADPRRAGQ